MRPRSLHEVPFPSPEAIEDVRYSCVDLPDDSVLLAERFYEHLFALVPEIRSMFSTDMSEQHVRMSRALLGVVRGFGQPQRLQQYLRHLGAQHHSYGVQPEHYPYVGRAIVYTVRDLSPTWSSHMSSSWVQVYEWIAANMLEGARESAESQRTVPKHRAPEPETPRPDPSSPAGTRHR